MTDFEGARLRILGMSEKYGFGYYETDDIWVESTNGEQFNDAIFDRNLVCTDKYNFEVEFVQSDTVKTDISSAVAAGLDICDLFFENWGNMFALSKSGNMRDLREIDTLDLSNVWWDRNANADLALANRLFYTTGELTTTDDRCTRFIYFNKDLAEKNNLDDPYQLVRDGKWTLDVFAGMTKAVYNDVNGNGKTDPEDTMGFFVESGIVQFFLLAAGQRYVQLDEDGYPRYSFLTGSEDYMLLEKIVSLLTDTKNTYPVNSYTDLGGYSNRYTYGRSLFAGGRHLFTIGGSLVIEEFRDMEDEFGILPMPKYSEEQESYYHTVETSVPFIAVPGTVSDTSELGMMLEYYAYEGMNILTPVFRETLLERKYTRDAESAEMLAIIYENKSYDLAHVANWGGVASVAYDAVAAGRIPQASSYKKISTAMDKLTANDYNAVLNAGK